MPKPCPIDKRSGNNNKSECISLKAWRILEQIITHQIFSKQIGSIVKCKNRKKRINPQFIYQIQKTCKRICAHKNVSTCIAYFLQGHY
jgi:hypothetical protein